MRLTYKLMATSQMILTKIKHVSTWANPKNRALVKAQKWWIHLRISLPLYSRKVRTAKVPWIKCQSSRTWACISSLIETLQKPRRWTKSTSLLTRIIRIISSPTFRWTKRTRKMFLKRDLSSWSNKMKAALQLLKYQIQASKSSLESTWQSKILIRVRSSGIPTCLGKVEKNK